MVSGSVDLSSPLSQSNIFLGGEDNDNNGDSGEGEIYIHRTIPGNWVVYILNFDSRQEFRC